MGTKFVALMVGVTVLVFGLLVGVCAAVVGVWSQREAAALTVLGSEGLSPVVLEAYVSAAQRCEGLEWWHVAGVGRVESAHGTFGGGSVDVRGVVSPPVYGPVLDGSGGFRAVPDSDGGVLDGVVVWDRAVGPFQFIPTSWAVFGVDGDGDGIVDPHNVFDAAAAAAGLLCTAASGSIDSDAGLAAALRAYNDSVDYVTVVLEWARRYELLAGTGVGGVVCPVPGSSFTDSWGAPRSGGRAHKGVDMFAPSGALVFAPEAGRAEFYWNDLGGWSYRLYGVSGVYYYGTHLSGFVGGSRTVAAGEPLGLVGTSGNAAGTPPHLHFQVHPGGRGTPAVNPTLLVATACANTTVLFP